MKFLTDRLILRILSELDAEEIFSIRRNAMINQFLERNPPKNNFEALDFILEIKKKSSANEIVFFGISIQEYPKLVGTICLWNFSADRKTAELGYELLPEFHGKGIMSEAVDFLLDHGFNHLNLNKIEAFTKKNNLNSIKLLEKSKFILNPTRKDIKFPENLIFERTPS